MTFFVLQQTPRVSIWKAAAAATLALACTTGLYAQRIAVPVTGAAEPMVLASVDSPVTAGVSSSASLPDAPSTVAANEGTLVASLPAPAAGEAPKTNVAPRYAKYIASTETAQKINAHDKVIIGLRDLYSFENLLAIPLSAAYEQVTNGEPNYGQDFHGYGQRVGAAAVRETSQGLFTDVVFSPLLHMDPRYFAEGDGTSFLHRFFYAGTRVLIGRTDSGRQTINAPLLLGYAATAAMTPLYYPQINHNFNDVASGYGGSLGGAAIGFLFSEFSDSLLESLHLKKQP